MKYFIYWTAGLKSSKPWSSQLWTQFKQLRIEAWKSQDFNGVWTRDFAIPVRRSNQLSYEATNQLSYETTSHPFFTGSLQLTNDQLHFTSIPHGLIRTHKWPAPNVSGFIAQLVRASHRYREVLGSNPVEVLTFSGFCIRNCLNCVHNCDDHSLLDFKSAVQYMNHFIYHFTE